MTAPFGAALEAALKSNTQSGRLYMMKGAIHNPSFFCCISGLNVNKDPVANFSVSTRRECTNTNVTVNVALSWSPTSTINSYEIDWGDGNITSGSWPPAGPDSHPEGGYTLPGTYTITVTVTDLIGATGTAESQIEIVDCSEFATIEAYCALYQAGAPAIWYTNDAGGNWADRSGNVLQDTMATDVKIHPFSIPSTIESEIDNTANVELWTATEKGLYRAIDGARTAESWKPITLPAPEVGIIPYPLAVCCSKYDAQEVYVLACGWDSPNRVWLYRTTDSGETWANVELAPGVGTYQIPNEGWTHLIDMSANGQYVYVGVLRDLHPVILRVEYDLSSYSEVYAPGNGSWGGVRCDYNYPEIVWIFGDFGEGTTILNSEDFGDTWNDVSVPSWTGGGHGGGVPLVRPVLPSPISASLAFAVNNDTTTPQLETAMTLDFGATWFVSSVASPFACHCGEMGWWDDLLVFLGRQGTAANHLQMSVNLGMTMWTERSGGLPANAPVSAIQILLEHHIFVPG